MDILIIKMSSLGDAIHTLPAITDITNSHPNAKITWLIEPGFSAVASWHPAVSNIVPIPLRKLKNNLLSANNYANVVTSIKTIRKLIIEDEVGPQFIEIATYRWCDHVGINEDFHLNYRSKEELNKYKEIDPLIQVKNQIDPKLWDKIDKEIEEEIAVAIRFAEESKFPDNEELLKYVYQ